MISWEKAQLLSQHEFSLQLMLALSDAGITTTFQQTLSELTYIDISEISAWFSLSHAVPLPQSKRHHLWLAVYHKTFSALNKYRSSKGVKLKRWTDEEDEFIIKNYHHMTRSEIGKVLVRTAIAVGGRCKVLGLTKNSRKNYETYDDEELKLLEDTSLSNREVADKLERPIGCIWMKRKQLGIDIKNKATDVLI